ncbi:MAG: RHS repeat protein [Oscillospiraceae bacterium]|nr:RHS repeat protein [Oscillospiraceae bacterium]
MDFQLSIPVLERVLKHMDKAITNINSLIDKGVRTDYSYNAANQLKHLKNSNHTQEFNYDARGNLTQILENDKIRNTYEFSPLNRLTKAVNASGQTSNYEYNGV